jgi:hypothetical protein
MGGVTFELGEPVRIEMEKWGGRPHWQFEAQYLGTDEHGDWIAIPAETPMSRPGYALVSRNDQVGLVPPRDLPDEERGWLATFHGEPRDWVAVYVDITTPPVWDGATVRTVDLDLDVIRRVEGEVFVDDEDEFAEHQVAFGYPARIVAAAQRSCELVRDAVVRGLPPYDGSHERWLATLAGLTARS